MNDRSMPAGLDLGEIEKIVDEADHVRAGGVDVLEVFLVAVVADRPETLLQHHLGKADDGVERRADLVADLGEEIGFLGARLLGRALGADQLALGLLEGGDVAQDGAELAVRPIAQTAHGHEERDRAALAHPARGPRGRR